MQRIGVIADNHSGSADGADLPQAVLDAFTGVDLIVHCGDAGTWGTLDRLATVAPVVGVRGGHNGTGEDERITGGKRILEIDGMRAGVVHDLVGHKLVTQSVPKLLPIEPDFPASLERFFGGEIDMLLYAGTHVPRLGHIGGLFLVNPGSATLPADRPKPSLGTVAIVEVDGGVASARVLELWR